MVKSQRERFEEKSVKAAITGKSFVHRGVKVHAALLGDVVIPKNLGLSKRDKKRIEDYRAKAAATVGDIVLPNRAKTVTAGEMIFDDIVKGLTPSENTFLTGNGSIAKYGLSCPKCGGHLRVAYTRHKSGEIRRVRVCVKCKRRVPTVEKPILAR